MGKRARNPRRLTYGDFVSDGRWDCGHAFDPDMFELHLATREDTPVAIVDRAFEGWMGSEDSKQHWIEQQDDFEGLDPDKAYEAWKEGWRSCAISSVESMLDKVRQQQLDDLTLYFLMVGDDDSPIEQFEDLDGALAMLAQIPSGRIYEGDGNGPNYLIAYAEPDSDELTRKRGPEDYLFPAKRVADFRNRRANARRRNFQRNPAGKLELDDDGEAAVERFKDFHRYDPNRLEDLGSLKIPARVKKLGAAQYVLYRSGKVDPSTLKKPRKPVDYIHEHDAGVMVYTTDGGADTNVPKEFREVTALVRLGKCLGFGLRDGTEAKGAGTLPDLACTPDGKCLLVIQDRREVLAMFWGGALGVFPRGIDG